MARVPDVKQLQATSDVKGLVKALSYTRDWEDPPTISTAALAAEALGELGDTSAVKALIGALKRRQWPVQAAAARALGKLQDRRATNPLLSNTRDHHWAVVSSAAEALGEIGDPAARQRLTELLQWSAPARPLGDVDPRLRGLSLPQMSSELASIESKDVRKAARKALKQLE